MVDSVSERWNRPTEGHARDLALQRIQITIRMRAHWVLRWNNMVRTTLTHMGIRVTFPFELLPGGLLGFLGEFLVGQAVLGILRIRLVCPEWATALILEPAVSMFVRPNPAISEAVIEGTHAWAFKDS